MLRSKALPAGTLSDLLLPANKAELVQLLPLTYSMWCRVARLAADITKDMKNVTLEKRKIVE